MHAGRPAHNPSSSRPKCVGSHGGADPRRSQSDDDPTMHCRAPVRHDQANVGRRTIPDERTKGREGGSSALHSRLQYPACGECLRGQRDHAELTCGFASRRQTPAGGEAGPRVLSQPAPQRPLCGERPAGVLGPAACCGSYGSAPSGACGAAGRSSALPAMQRLTARRLLAASIFAPRLARPWLGAPPPAHFGAASAQLRAGQDRHRFRAGSPAAGSPRSRPSVCTPGLADGQGFRRALRLQPMPQGAGS